ncbi:MAG TPA: hypothetical protein VKP65_08020 [Rhodothermales bacterium]|nr:hypothetical protein [Rhodothermales bacterium]
MPYNDSSPLDEYTLAAFLSGTLPEEKHREVLRHLADNEEARELVCMAQDALEAAREPVTEPFAMPEVSSKPTAAPRPARAPTRPALSLVRWKPYAVAAMVLVMLTIGLQVGLFDNTDTLRGGEEASTLTLQVDNQTLAMSWNALPNAYSYIVVVWDVEAAESVARHELRAAQLDITDAFVQQLHEQLEEGREYEVRVDARNDENSVIQRADLFAFTYQP